jgi:membrane fusion protein, multidrug efflux system
VTAAEEKSSSGADGQVKSEEDGYDRGGNAAGRSEDRIASKPADRERSWLTIHRVAATLFGTVALLAAGAGGAWWMHARHYEDTDDAFIDARPSAISAQVAAAIVDVPVTDNEVVQPGQPLVHLDDRDYRAAQAQAEAQKAQADATIASAEAQSSAQQATIDQMSLDATQAQAALSYSRDENERAQTLLKEGSGTLEQAQQTRADLIQKEAAFNAAQAALLQSKRQLAVLAAQRQVAEAQHAQAQAQLALANANLSRTLLVAPFKGRVTELTAAKGAYATPGQALMLIVPLDVWVTANFRETQLADMRAGQPADLCIDAYGRCFPGHVDSIQAGSGTAFSLLPAENATGNYVKVVQRVPVKLVFNKQPDLEVGPGMSVTPSVKVR